jgi:hypothetical protein
VSSCTPAFSTYIWHMNKHKLINGLCYYYYYTHCTCHSHGGNLSFLRSFQRN